MARIFTYNQDESLNLNDKVIGSNSGDNVTKNYTVESLLGVANSENFIKQFDGIVFKVQDYNNDSDQFGIITTGTGAYTNTNFSDIQTIYLSEKNFKEETVDKYIDVLEGYDVRITKKGDTNNFGIYRVDTVEDVTGQNYKKLTVTVQDDSGQLEKGAEYYISTLGNNLKNLNSFSVTSLNDITSAGSGAIITDAERANVALIGDKVNYTDVRDNLTSTESTYPLSANQGKILKGYIDAINTTLTSDNVDLDSLQEVVDYIEANKDTLDNLSISNVAGLQTALDGKVDEVAGKGLSANDFTDALQTKLNNIEANAEVNVQADWNETDSSADDFIQNKPTDVTDLSTHNVTELLDITSAGSGAIITSAERTKLTGLAAGAEANVQSNWNETDTNADSFIQNKPVILNQNTTLTISGTANEIETTPSTAQDLSANRTFTIGLPNDVTIGNDLTVTNDATITADLSADNVTVDDILSFTTSQSSAPSASNAIYVEDKDSTSILHFRYDSKDLAIDDVTENIPSGVTSGGILAKVNTTQFSITAGTGIINDLNKEDAATEPHPEIKHITWSAQTLTCTGLDTNNDKQLNTWIYIDATGTLNQQTSPFTDAQYVNNIIIGSVIHTSGTIDFVKTFPITAYSNTAQMQEFIRIFGPLKKSGHKVTANGANLKLDRAAGTAFAIGRNYTSDPNNPSIVSDSARTSALIHRYYADGSNGHTLDSNDGAGYAGIDPTKYDDGDGTLANVSSGHYSVQRLYYFPATPSIIVAYYGKASYNSMDTAEKSYLQEDFTEADNTATQAIYLGALIVKGSTTALNNSSHAKILTAGAFRSLAAVNLGGVSAAQQLGDLSDVNISAVANNHILKYNSTNTRFENVSLSTDDITEGSTNLFDQTVAFTDGANISVTGTYPNFTIASSHPSITAASSADNSGLTYIQDITLDSNGHVTGLTSQAIATAAITDGGTDLATADQIHTFVTGQGYISGNESITLSGDITGSGTTAITTTIAANAIEGSMLNNNVISGQTALTTGLASTDEMLVSDAGNIKRMDVDVLKTYMQNNLTFTTNTDADVTKANLKTRLAEFDSTDTVYIGDSDDDTTVVIRGNLQVDGTTTTINSETLSTAENDLVLNNDATGTPTQDASLQVERGTSTNASILWDESAGIWKSGLLGSEYKILTENDEGSGNGIDSDTLDGQEGSYYLAYANFTGTPTIPSAANDATITLSAGTGLSGGGDFTTDQSSNETITFNLDFSELSDMTSDISANTEFVLREGAAAWRKTANEISLKHFRNDIAVTVSNSVYYIDGTQQADVTLQPGFKYRFTHPTSHPLRFSTDSSNNTAFTTGVTTSSTYTEILVEQDTPKTLYYYCANHSNMGGTVYVGAGVRSITAGTGLSGSSITESGTIALDINSLTAETALQATDFFAFYDNSAATIKKISRDNLKTELTVTAGAGLTLTSGTIDIDSDLRSDVTKIGYDTNGYYEITSADVHNWYSEQSSAAQLNMRLEADGDLLVRQDVVAYSTVVASDESLKDNIVTIPDALETVQKLRGVEFDWKYGAKEGQHDIGVVAQEVEKVIPHIVYSKKMIDSDEKIKTVDYEKMTAVLIEAVKDLTNKVNNLEKQLANGN